MLSKARQERARQPPRSRRQGRWSDHKRLKLKTSIEAQVHGREKHLYSIYRKMREKHLSFAKVHDVFGFRIIVKDVPSCYLALGALHSPVQADPRQVQGLHRDSESERLPVAAHHAVRSFRQPDRNADPHPGDAQDRRSRRRVALALQEAPTRRSTSCSRRPTSGCRACSKSSRSAGDSIEFLEHLKVDLFPDEVYVFTPKGKIMSLPRGATAVDFAYAVHTDIGNRCVAVKINQELMPLRTELKNGERVEIITAAHAKPNPLWLNFVVTAKARSHIRHFLKTDALRRSPRSWASGC